MLSLVAAFLDLLYRSECGGKALVKALKSLKFFVVSSFALWLMSGCAAQTTYRDFYDAKTIFERAQSIDPLDPRVQRAEISLEAGERELRDARFGRATEHFREVTRLSNRVLMASDPDTIESARGREEQDFQRIQQSNLERRAAAGSSEEEGAGSASSSALSSEDLERMSLPEKALAAYLARKSQAERQAPSAPAAPPEPKEPPPVVKDSPDRPSVTGERQAELSAGEASSTREVRASSERRTQEAPGQDIAEEAAATRVAVAQRTGEPEPAIEEPAVPVLDGDDVVSARDFEPPRRKYPQDILFSERDVSLRTTEMDKLDEVGQFLIENPSNSLIMLPRTLEGERSDLVEQRFQAIRAYLQTRGVPEDQVRLDPAARPGDNPRFELYLIDH